MCVNVHERLYCTDGEILSCPFLLTNVISVSRFGSKHLLNSLKKYSEINALSMAITLQYCVYSSTSHFGWIEWKRVRVRKAPPFVLAIFPELGRKHKH